MASAHRKPPDPLTLWRERIDVLRSHDFYSAMRCAECAHHDRPRLGEARRPQEEPLRLGQEPSLEFAPATFSSVETMNGSGLILLRQCFFGVLGPNGPLPLHLTEFVRDRVRNHDDHALVRFLDLFHHRLLTLFYRTWASAQPVVNYDRPGRDRFANYLGALVGIAQQSLRRRDSVPDTSKLSFAGLLGRHSRNAEGLENILRGFFRVPVAVQPFRAHWMALPEHLLTRLGNPDLAQLGRTTVIGRRVWDLQSRFSLVVGPLTLAGYQRFLPNAPSQKRLVDWVRNYVGLEFKWDCLLVLKRDEVPSLTLGFGARLGWTTWLGTRLTDEDARDLAIVGD